MSDMKDFLRDVGYFGVGAAAVVVEAGGKVVKALVKKGRKTLEDNQETVDEIKRQARKAGERIKDAVDRATSAPEEPPVEEGPVTPDAIYHTDEPVPVEEPVVAPVDEPEAAPVAEPVVTPVEEPVPAPIEEPEKPEETVNG